MDQKTAACDAHVHRYATRCTWSGSTGSGYEHYSRAHEVGVPSVVGSLHLSSDPAFRGDPSRMNPEQLLVMAASSCQLLSFLAVAARARLDVVAYDDEAQAEMPANEKPVRIVTIRLRPHIVLNATGPGIARDEKRVRQLVELAHRECYIANSLKAEVSVEPVIEWR